MGVKGKRGREGVDGIQEVGMITMAEISEMKRRVCAICKSNTGTPWGKDYCEEGFKCDRCPTCGEVVEDLLDTVGYYDKWGE